MQFNSLIYALFLPAVYVIFYFTADRWRWLVLLGASYAFYTALKAPYLLAVLLMVTGLSYACGLRMALNQDDAIRKRWLWIGSFACVSVLALLKYFPFLESHANSIFGLNNTFSQTIVIIGASYYTLQAIAYLADIYLEILEPEKHFGHYALYLAFFPKLLQGPIERAGDLLPQLKKPYKFDYENIRFGLLMIAWGLFKKVVVADRLGIFVDPVYNDVHSNPGVSLLLATYYYAIQIYCDFSGYTDIAIGTARIFNINLTQNFNNPYLATSVADYWRRWHISFSRWILDYVFKPLQMQWRNWKNWGTASALIVTFLVSGMWHGARWGFLVWGLLHGIYLAVSVFASPALKKLYKKLGLENTTILRVLQRVATFNLVCFAWIFFRANSLSDALYILKSIFSLSVINNVRLPIISIFTFGQSVPNFIILILSIGIILLVNIFKDRISFFEKPLLFRWCSCVVFVSWIVLLYYDSKDSFIYAKF